MVKRVAEEEEKETELSSEDTKSQAGKKRKRETRRE